MDFDQAAATWDTPGRIQRGRHLGAAFRETISAFLGRKEHLIGLEIGCGTGLITVQLAYLFEKLYACDSSSEMLKSLETKKESLGEPLQTKIVLATPEQLRAENPEGVFDVVLSSMVFHHFSNLEEELGHLVRWMKAKGLFLLVDLDQDDGRFHQDEEDFQGHHGFQRDELQKILERAGLCKIRFCTAYQGVKETTQEALPYSLFLCRAEKKEDLEG